MVGFWEKDGKVERKTADPAIQIGNGEFIWDKNIVVDGQKAQLTSAANIQDDTVGESDGVGEDGGDSGKKARLLRFTFPQASKVRQMSYMFHSYMINLFYS
jgi:hypothetical protein